MKSNIDWISLLLTKGLTIIDNKFETLVEKFQLILNKNKSRKIKTISIIYGEFNMDKAGLDSFEIHRKRKSNFNIQK